MKSFVILYSSSDRSNLYKYVQRYCTRHPGNGYNEVYGICEVGDAKISIKDGLLVRNMTIEDALRISKRLNSEFVLSSDARCYKCICDDNESNVCDFSFVGYVKYPGGYSKKCSYKELRI